MRLSYLLYTQNPPKEFKACEVGVSAGDNAVEMLKDPRLRELVLVDPYIPNDKGFTYDVGRTYSPKSAEKFYEGVKYRMASYGDRVKQYRERSVDVAKKYPNEYFDYIYIDAVHDTPHVLEDLNSWWGKLKPYGMMAGHDSTNEGVAGAVQLFSQKMSLSPLLVSIIPFWGYALPFTDWIDWWIIKFS